MGSADSVEMESTGIERKHLQIVRANEDCCDRRACHQGLTVEQGPGESACCESHAQ